MDAVILARLQFAVAVFFHFIFVPLTLGLGLLVAIMQTMWFRSGNDLYKRMTKFWGKLFVINFVLGVVTGITLVFQFGTNWARYSEYVGDIFGSLLAIEAIVAFFLESTFLGVWIFGWERVSKKIHLLAIWIVVVASNLSAVWIILANGWMQNPIGAKFFEGTATTNPYALLDSFYAVVTNEYAWGQFFHNFTGSMLVGGFFVLGIASWHLVRKSHVEFFSKSFKIAAIYSLIGAFLVIAVGHYQGNTIARLQPTKLAAMELHWETNPAGEGAPMYLLAWPNSEGTGNSVQIGKIPSILSIMAFNHPTATVKGLNDPSLAELGKPPLLLTFLNFRLMVGLAGLFVLISLVAFIYRNKAERVPKLILKLLPWAIPLPYIAIMAGWAVAEIGRQPWIVYGKLKTADAVSTNVSAGNVATSLVAFIIVYGILGLLDIYLLRKDAIQGPENE